MRRTTAAAVTAVALILGTVALTLPSNPQHPTKGTDMAQPGILSSQIPPGEDHVMRRIADLERAIREMRAADILRTAGLIAAPNLLTVAGGLVVDGSETVNGPLAVTGVADISGTTHIGGALDVDATANFDGNTTIGGTLAVTGTLSLPAGIIDNEALAHQVVVGSAAAEFGMSSAFPLSGSPGAPTTLLTLNVLVPADATSAIATTSVVPAIYTASGTGTFTATVESSLISGGSGAFSYAAEIVDVVGAATSAITVTKPIVLASVTPGAVITMRATAYASGAGVLAEGDGSLTVMFLR